MSVNKFTPGPWVAAEVRHGYDQVIRDADGNPICALLLAGWDKASQRSHAHLIAAAPDLLTALEKALTALETRERVDGYSKTTEAAVKSARAAIAKART